MLFSLKQEDSRPITARGEHLPFASLIMPVRNEAAFIDRSLGAVLAQDYPHDLMELLIADGMSTDGTRDVIARLSADQDIPVIVLDNPGLIASTGMNIAIERARGDIIFRVDGHTLLEPDYVSQCVAVLKRSEADNVGGPMRATGEDYLTEAISLATSTPFGLGNSAFHYSRREQYVDTVYMGAFRKETLLRAGLFDENFVRHQDYELNYRIRKNGGKIFLSPNIRSRYYVRDSLRKFCKQYMQYGFWKAKLLKRNPDSLKWRHVVAPLFVLSLFLGLMLSFSVRDGGVFLIFLGSAYFLFLAIGTIMTCKFKYLKYVPLLPVIFTCLHLSWGLGVWMGFLSHKLQKEFRENDAERL